jgi:serine acetyltransferase
MSLVMPERPDPEHGLLELIWSDYEMHCDFKQESHRKSLLMAPLRLITNTSLRAGILFRLTCASPRWLHWFWRSVLVTLHSSEVGHGARIGPRFHMPHPSGIGIGPEVTIGTGVTIFQHVSLGADLAGTGQPQLCDNVIVLANATVFGPVRVGAGAVVGSNCVLEKDLADGGIAAPARTRIVNRRVNHAMNPVEGRGPRPA